VQHFSESLEDLRAALPVLTDLARRNPEMIRYRAEVAVGRATLGYWLQQTGEYAQARDSLKIANVELEAIAAFAPEIEYRQRRAVSRGQLALALEALGEHAAADTEFQAAASELSLLRSQSPDMVLLRGDVAWLHYWRGQSLWDRGSKDEAIAEWKQAAQTWRELLETWPAAEYELAAVELFANSPAEEVRDIAFAVRLAESASTQAPNSPRARTALAVAHYRTGAKDNCAALLAANRREGRPLAQDCFLEALLLAESDPAAAQRRFDAGIAMLQQRRGDRELRRLADEAAQTLEIRVPKPAPSAGNL
jgi:tetratricopeptide (TPR) repeat protein